MAPGFVHISHSNIDLGCALKGCCKCDGVPGQLTLHVDITGRVGRSQWCPYRSRWTSQAGAEVPQEKHDEAVRWGPRLRTLVPQRTNTLRPKTSDGASVPQRQAAGCADRRFLRLWLLPTHTVCNENASTERSRTGKITDADRNQNTGGGYRLKRGKKGPSVVNKYILLELCFTGLYIFKNSPCCTLKNSPFYTPFCIYVIPQ